MLQAKYRIVRFRFKAKPFSKPRTIKRGLTLEQAQAWCQNPETSSSTCTGRVAMARTARGGAWFDGYEEEKG